MGRGSKKMSTKTYRKVSVRQMTREDRDDAKFLKANPLADLDRMEEEAGRVDAEMRADAEAKMGGGEVRPRISKKVRKMLGKKKREAGGGPGEEEGAGVPAPLAPPAAPPPAAAPPAPPAPLPAPAANLSFAEQMMAQLSSLKSKTLADKPLLDAAAAKSADDRADKEAARVAAIDATKNTGYKPAAPRPLRDPAALNVTSGLGISPAGAPLLSLSRPPSISATRSSLPVAAMEQEIVEAIGRHDVLVLCGETGSGKSTQTPQFVYEAGYTCGGGETAK
jgi:hypothetical protein